MKAAALLIALAALAVATCPSPAAPWAAGKDERPAWVGPSPARAPLDCDGAPVLMFGAGFDSTLAGTTEGVANVNAGYSCVAWDESGGEAVFRLMVTADVILAAELLPTAIDHDLFLLTACDGDACWAAGNSAFGVWVAPGEYFLVVDGYEGAAGPFTVVLRTLAVGVPDEVCAGGATAVECATGPQEFDDTLWQAPNAIEMYDCSPYLEKGGERWYAVTMRDSTVTATIATPPFDAALWLFDGCGPGAVCLAFADANPAGENETLVFDNGDTGVRRTVYLAVDALRPIATAFDGGYTLSIRCARSGAVPAARTSWGALKAQYR